MTEDERLILATTIALHDYQLYEKWIVGAGIWLPMLVGPQCGHNQGQAIHRCISETTRSVTKPGVALVHHKLGWSDRWQRLEWFRLTDSQLRAFYNTVVHTSQEKYHGSLY